MGVISQHFCWFFFIIIFNPVNSETSQYFWLDKFSPNWDYGVINLKMRTLEALDFGDFSCVDDKHEKLLKNVHSAVFLCPKSSDMCPQFFSGVKDKTNVFFNLIFQFNIS